MSPAYFGALTSLTFGDNVVPSFTDCFACGLDGAQLATITIGSGSFVDAQGSFLGSSTLNGLTTLTIGTGSFQNAGDLFMDYTILPNLTSLTFGP